MSRYLDKYNASGPVCTSLIDWSKALRSRVSIVCAEPAAYATRSWLRDLEDAVGIRLYGNFECHEMKFS
jgi:hypothetical protein